MKFRATTNSIRIRVRKSDLEQLKTTEWVYEGVELPGGPIWSFGLLIDGEEIAARLKDNTVIVSLPKQIAMDWIDTEQVGIEHYLLLDNGQQLHILIEKDFPCKNREEDISDTFFELDQEAC